MGTRTTRIPSNLLQESKERLSGHLVQVVLWEGSTKTGTIESITDTGLILKDPNSMWYNRKRHSHRIEFSSIREVLLDEISEW